MNTPKDIFKNLFLYGSPILIGMGIIKLFFYYSFFNVEITRFITITEVLTYFTGDIVFYLALGLITFIFTYLTNKTHVFKYKRHFLIFCKTDNVYIRLIKFACTSRFYITFLITLIFYVIFVCSKSYIREFMGYLAILNAIYFLISFSIQEIKRKDRIRKKLLRINFQYEIYSYILLRILSLIFVYTLVEVQRVKHESRYINTKIVLDDRVISSDSTNFYIGNTINYIFIYNKTIDQTSVFPMTRVKQLNFGDIYYLPKIKTPTNTR